MVCLSENKALDFLDHEDQGLSTGSAHSELNPGLHCLLYKVRVMLPSAKSSNEGRLAGSV